MAKVTALETIDLRFPTSRDLSGSDAMNPDPDYSAAYLTLRTDDPALTGHGFVFTIGRGNDVQCAAIEALAPEVVGRDVDGIVSDLGAFSRSLVNDSQFRWLGPEKGIMHMAIGAVVNAAWDLAAQRAGLPLWELLASMTPQQLVDCVDFRYLTDVLTPDQALAILEEGQDGKADRIARLKTPGGGIPAYTTTPGWLGYPIEKVVRLAKEAVEDGYTQIKLKVGNDLDDDRSRLRAAREAVGPGVRIAIDANQKWDVDEAIAWVKSLAEFDLAWIEEPTSPDDVLGHAAIRRGLAGIPVATGEHAQNRVIFKQLLQAEAIDVMQIDAARVGGVNENLANLLLAKKYGIPVCPHAGGVGLCELVQHLSFFDAAVVGLEVPERRIEFVNHLHEHFHDPARALDGVYLAPEKPGFSAAIKEVTFAEYRFPDGSYWQSEAARG
jgi:L-fuconate dehydratase